MSERLLNMLGLMRKAGAIAIGEVNTVGACRAGKAKVLLLAADASDNARSRAEGFTRGRSTVTVRLPFTKEDISAHVGVNGCSMAAVTDIGFADAVAKKLAALDPEKFTGAAERMAIKAQRARERKLEQLAHEKNVRAGKKRPPKPLEKAAPPEHESRGGGEKKKTSQPARKERGAAARSRQKAQARVRFEGSKPVKKGKGSGRKKS